MKPKQAKAATPDGVLIPQELWEKIEQLVKHGRNVRCTPENWPLTPEQMAGEVRRLHFWLREIDESEPFLGLCVLDAAKKLAALNRKQSPNLL